MMFLSKESNKLVKIKFIRLKFNKKRENKLLKSLISVVFLFYDDV